MDLNFVTAAGLFILGTLVGSFINVVVWRLPRGESLVVPRSRCPSCLKQIAWFDNFPILSWLLLRGKCRKCSADISFRYIAIEFLSGVLFIFSYMSLATQAGAQTNIAFLIELVALLCFASICLVVAFIDGRTGKIPNSQVALGIGIALLLNLGSLIADFNGGTLIRSLFAGMISLTFFTIVKAISPNGIGWGDVKLILPIGMILGFFGWGALILGGLATFAGATAYAVIMMLAKKKKYSSLIYFGPWIVAGTWFGILFGEQAWGLYINFIEWIVR